VSVEPSILSADFARLGEQAREAEKAGAEGIQIDVMDGHFVPNITFGAGTVRALRNVVDLFLDVHLMIDTPEKFVTDFAHAGADRIIIHQETSTNLHRIVQSIKDLKVEAGVALNPGTPLAAVEEVFDLADCFQVMTVNPGFAGQRFIMSQLNKVKRLSMKLKEGGFSVLIAVDGGIDANTAPLAVRSGASVLVAGSSVFNNKGTVAENLHALRTSLKSTR
jgi:ribulose-phosphate 3-epimerase